MVAELGNVDAGPWRPQGKDVGAKSGLAQADQIKIFGAAPLLFLG